MPLVIYEATGAYHRQLERPLGAKALPFVKVNPKQARRFAQAAGKLAKTDRVDSEMLARMGAAVQLTPKIPQAENLYDLTELLADRVAGCAAGIGQGSDCRQDTKGDQHRRVDKGPA